MKILRMDRRKGKTTELIKIASEKDLYIICADKHRADIINSVAMKMNLHIPYPITINELPIRSPYIKEVLVDDMEDLLITMVRKPILLATTSCEVISENKF